MISICLLLVPLLALLRISSAQDHGVRLERHSYQNYLHQNNLSRYCRQVEAELAVPGSDKELIKRAGSWYFYYWEPNWSCPLEERVMWLRNHTKVTAGDGGKWICDVPSLLHKKDCLIYSVGSNGQFLFESGLMDLIGTHCEIHVFDIDEYTNRGHYPDKYWDHFQRHHWGFGVTDEVVGGRPLKSLLSTMRDLGHTGRTISILKMDIEGNEFGIIDNPKFWADFDASGSKIEQLQLEVHLKRYLDFDKAVKREETGATMDALLRALTGQGFAMFHKEINQLWPLGCEFAFLRTFPNCTDFAQSQAMDTSYAGVKARLSAN